MSAISVNERPLRRLFIAAGIMVGGVAMMTIEQYRNRIVKNRDI